MSKYVFTDIVPNTKSLSAGELYKAQVDAYGDACVQDNYGFVRLVRVGGNCAHLRFKGAWKVITVPKWMPDCLQLTAAKFLRFIGAYT